MNKTLGILTFWLLLNFLNLSLPSEAAKRRLPPEEKARLLLENTRNFRFRRVTLQNVDLPLALLALALKEGFNCGLEPRPEDDMIFGGSGEKAYKVSINLRDVTLDEVLSALRDQSQGCYEWIWDRLTVTLNVFPVPRPAPPEEKEIYPPRWSSVVLPSFSLECACYSEAMRKLLSHPALKGFNVSFVPSGGFNECGNGEFSFLGEDADIIRLTAERKGWTIRQWLNLIHKKVSVLSQVLWSERQGRPISVLFRVLWWARSEGTLISVGWINGYSVPKGSVILIERAEEKEAGTPVP